MEMQLDFFSSFNQEPSVVYLHIIKKRNNSKLMLSGFGFIWMTGFFPFARKIAWSHMNISIYTFWSDIRVVCSLAGCKFFTEDLLFVPYFQMFPFFFTKHGKSDEVTE